MLERVPLAKLHPLRAMLKVLVGQEVVLRLRILLPRLLLHALTEKELSHTTYHFFGILIELKLDLDGLSGELAENPVVLAFRLDRLCILA